MSPSRVTILTLAVLVVLPCAARAQTPNGAAIYKQRCAACHDAPDASRAPSLESLKARSVQVIMASLATGGAMAEQGKELSIPERQAVATYLAAGSAAPSTSAPDAPASPDPSVGSCAAGAKPMGDPASGPGWNGWGDDPSNGRFQDASGTSLTAATVPKLTLKWAFGFAGATSSSGQPTVAGGRVFVGNENGMFYALDAATGCTHWTYKVGAGVRTAPSVGRVTGPNGPVTAVFFGDLRANAIALDANTGALLWKTTLDEHPAARITGAPTLDGARVYVPVSSIEEAFGGGAKYECCTFRGSLAALDAGTGKIIWQTYMIPDKPQMVGKNSAGTPLWKPAGVAVWTAPTIDRAKGVMYVGTGNAYTEPAAPTSDAVVAIDLKTGAILWASQITPSDVFVINCRPGNENCPKEVGPDHDFGNSPILRTLPNGRRVLLAGQKSGTMYGLDPDNKGAVLWRFRAGKGGMLGGIEWGSAADETTVYVPVSDVLLSAEQAGGLFAVNISDGAQRWHAAPVPLTCKGGQGCTSAQSAAISVIPGVVFSGSVDGHLRAYATTDGKIIWDFDTMREFETVNGVKASGGSIDSAGPVIAGGLVLTNSGYGRWRGKPGNVLLAFEVK